MSLLGLKCVLACSSLGLIVGVLAYDNGAIPRGKINFYSTASNLINEEGPSSSGQQITCTQVGGESSGFEVPQGVQITEEMRKKMVGTNGQCLDGEEDSEDEEEYDEDEEDEDEEIDLITGL